MASLLLLSLLWLQLSSILSSESAVESTVDPSNGKVFNLTEILTAYRPLNGFLEDLDSDKLRASGIEFVDNSVQISTSPENPKITAFYAFDPAADFNYSVLLKRLPGTRPKSAGFSQNQTEEDVDSCQNASVQFSVAGEDKECPYPYFVTTDPNRGQFHPEWLQKRVALDSPAVGECFPDPGAGIYRISLAVKRPDCHFALLLPENFTLLMPEEEIQEYTFKSKRDSDLEGGYGQNWKMPSKTFLILVICAVTLVFLILVVGVIVLVVTCLRKKKKGNYVLPAHAATGDFSTVAAKTDVQQTNLADPETVSAVNESNTDVGTTPELLHRRSNEKDVDGSILSGDTGPTQQMTPQLSRSSVTPHPAS